MNASGGKKFFEVGEPWFVGFTLAIVLQLCAGVWWAASVSERVAALESEIAALKGEVASAQRAQAGEIEKEGRMEERLSGLNDKIDKNQGEIAEHLTTIETYLYQQARKK